MREVTGSRWREGRAGRVGYALSLLALFCQLLGSLLMPMPARADAALALPDVICGIGHDAGSKQHQAPIHRAADCALCPVCLAATLHALSPAPPSIPAPPLVPTSAGLPPTRAGPSAALFRPTAQARAPPASV